MKSNKNYLNLNTFLNFGILTLVTFLSLSFITCDIESETDLTYTILKGDNQQNKQLLILLHGMNSNTEIWNDFTKSVDNKTLMVAVEAPIKTEINSYRWYDIDVSKKPFKSDVNQMVKSTNRIKDLIVKLKIQHKIETGNIIIAGFSQGAILSLNLGLSHPELVSGIGIFSGMLPEKIEERMSKDIKDLPVFLTHGSEDKGIDFSLAEKTNSFLKNKSANVKMTVEKSGHTISDKQFQDFINWSKTIE